MRFSAYFPYNTGNRCFYPHNYPSNFTGINAGRTATFARIAAKHALDVA